MRTYRAINLNPDFARAYNNRGIIYKTRKQFDSAIADLNKALAIRPNYPEAYHNRGNVYGTMGEYERALDDFNKAIAINPNLTEAYNGRAAAQKYIDQMKKHN